MIVNNWPLLSFAIVMAFLASDAWRWLSVFLSRRFTEQDESVIFAKMVATAVLAGVVAKILIFAPAELAEIPLWVRIVAFTSGIAAFALMRKSVAAAIIVGQGVLIGLGLLFG